MRKQLIPMLLALFLNMVSLNVSAYDFESDGIYYTINEDQTVTVTQGAVKYSGEVSIPSSITYDNQTYSVVGIGDNAFEVCTLSSIVISEGLKSIGNYAFYGCINLKTVIIPKTLTDIGNYAFYNCGSMTNIELPNSVSSIGENAFAECTSLTSIIIPNSVKTIVSVFNGCRNLKTVVIPNSVTSIGMAAFGNCSSLTSVNIPNSVTRIGAHAFYNCSSLKELKIPSSVVEISGGDSGAFYFCSGLESIVVETDNPKYDSRNNCNAIIETSTNKLIVGCKNTKIPNTVTSLEFWAFYGCKDLKTVFIPKSVTNFYKATFDGCNNIEQIIVEEGNPKYDSRNNCNAIIETTINEQANISTNSLIFGCKNSIIPNSVEQIGYSAFSDCTGLTEITIPSSVTTIGGSAFSRCSGLTSITIPGSVKRIGSNSFYETNISSVEFQHTKEQLDALIWNTKYTDDFKGPNETTLKFSEDVMNNVLIDYFQKRSDGFRYWVSANKECFEGIDGAAFYVKVTDGDNVSWISLNATPNGGELIVNSPAIDRTTIGALDLSQVNSKKDGSGKAFAVTSIGREAFAGCSGLTSIVIGEGLTSLSRELFKRCTSLTSVSIPNSVTTIEIGAFMECSSLTTIEIPDGVKTISEETFWKCSNLEFVALPESVTSIDGYAFDHCNKLTLVLPEQLTNIGKYALNEVKCAVFTSETAPRIVDGYTSEKCVVQQIAVPYNAIDAYSTLFAGLAGTTLGAVVSYETTPVSVNFEGTQVNSCKAKFTSYTLQDGVYDSREEESMVYGLDPESSVEYSWTLEDGNRVVYRNITTSALTFETQPAQATSNTKALISAKTNGEDDGLRFGFEWRRYDAPDLVPSNIVDCPVYEGVLAGTLNGLSANTYYKYRPFYKSDAGNVYYGEWMAFGTADTYVYFEPVVHTSNAQNVTENSATLSGTAVTGSDDIVEQGFEYWMSQGSSAAARRAPQDVQTIQATGMLMKVVLTGLQPGTTYVYRSYARTDKGTTYGEEKNFVTAGNTPTGINSMYVTEEAHETARYNLQGRHLSAPEKGVNIIRMSDGTTRKVFVK